MFQKFVNFIKYNNIAAIIISLVFGSVTASFAASPALRSSVYSSIDSIKSIDNHAIVSADLFNFNFDLKITSVTNDSINYFVSYSFKTLAIKDDVWQIVDMVRVLIVNKEDLGKNDLGIFAAKQLSDVINYELDFLKRTQKNEKDKGTTNKVITTEYSGL